MKFLLDTDHISILQSRTQPGFSRISTRVRRHSQKDFVYSIISFHEQTLGCNTYIARARSTNDLVRGYGILSMVLQDFRAFSVLEFDVDAAREFDSLQASRIRVATMDLRIASICLARGLVLLTRNVRDFGKVPGLVTEDWTL